MDATGYDDIRDLVIYYSKDKLDALLIKKAIQLLSGYNPERRAKIIDYLTETRPKHYGLDIPAIREAAKAAGVDRQEVWIESRQVTCDACGKQFKFAPYVTNDDEIDRGIHSRCPQCNFDYAWTEEAHDWMERRGRRPDEPPDWYEAQRKRYGDNNGLGKPPIFNRQQAELWRTKNAAKL